MDNNQPSQKTLGQVLAVVEKLGPQALASQFQQVALDLARQQQALEQEKAGFRQQRQRSDADIQEQSRELADAWLRLENERRNLETAADPSADQLLPANQQQPAEPQIAVYPVTPTNVPKPDCGNNDSTGPSLVEQFQLLAAGKTHGSHRS